VGGTGLHWINNDYTATPQMRIKDFPMHERLAPGTGGDHAGLTAAAADNCGLFSTGRPVWSGTFAQAMLTYGLPPSLPLLTGILAETVAVPLLLPWIPGRPFSLKGAICGLVLLYCCLLPPAL
jgi:acetyl-CoA decarbonylase/synthase complex subunit gamma